METGSGFRDEVVPAVLRQRRREDGSSSGGVAGGSGVGFATIANGFKITINFFPETFFEGVARDLLDENFVPLWEWLPHMC